MVHGAARRRGAAVMGMSGLLLAGCLAPPSGSPSAEESPAAVESALASASPTGDPVVGAGEEWIVYQWMAGSGDGIFLVRPDGTGHHQLVPDLAGSEIHPDWSPHGERIAFISVTPADRHELWVVDADGTNRSMLFSCDLPCNTVSYPDWVPDGAAIYYAMYANAPSDGPPTTFEVGRFDLGSGEAPWSRLRRHPRRGR